MWQLGQDSNPCSFFVKKSSGSNYSILAEKTSTKHYGDEATGSMVVVLQVTSLIDFMPQNSLLPGSINTHSTYMYQYIWYMANFYYDINWAPSYW